MKKKISGITRMDQIIFLRRQKFVIIFTIFRLGVDVMRLKNVLIAVNNIEKSKAFYKELFGLEIVLENEGNVILTEGLVLQDAAIWKDYLKKDIIPQNNATELYFEEWDIDTFVKKLEEYKEPIQYATPLMELPDGQKIIQLYDPDGHLIEVRTPWY